MTMTDDQLKLELAIKQYIDDQMEEVKKTFVSLEQTIEALMKTQEEQGRALSKMRLRILELESKRRHNHDTKRVLQ